jgi:hypothetical protein
MGSRPNRDYMQNSKHLTLLGFELTPVGRAARSYTDYTSWLSQRVCGAASQIPPLLDSS